MDLTLEVIDALVASGVTAEQLGAAVKAALAAQKAAKEAKRAKDAERKRRSRANDVHDVTRTERDNCGHGVTKRDPLSPLCPPSSPCTPSNPPISPQTPIPTSSGAEAPQTLETVVFRLGREVLGKSAGGQITKLRKALGFDDGKVLDVLTEAKTKADPSEWVAGVIRRKAADYDPYASGDIEAIKEEARRLTGEYIP